MDYTGSDSVIGAYAGDFDGNNHTIHNITVNSVDPDVGGLFDSISGDVYDLRLVDVSITTDSSGSPTSAGGLVGFP